MKVKRLIHACVLAHTAAGTAVFDPYLIDSLAQNGIAVPKADFIFITHGHYDHFSPPDIKPFLKDGTVIICPENLRPACERLAPVTETPVGLRVTAVPAYNIGKPFHKKSDGGLGYIIDDGESSLYVAGDTDLTSEVKAVRCDICALPVGGTYTMDASEAAQAAGCIMPRIAIPTHYGDIDSVAGSRAAAEFAALLPQSVRCDIFPPLKAE